MSDQQALAFCEEILPLVSRTFAINIRILKGDLYRSVLCAYLFCRVVDTIEDSERLRLSSHNHLIDEYVRLFRQGDYAASSLRLWVAEFGDLDTENAEARLIAEIDRVFRLFASLPAHAQSDISECVIEMALGMKNTINRPHTSTGLQTLDTIADLERYCYYVAGTVGVMLTRLFIREIGELAPSKQQELEKRQLAFAYGLQMTNIVKDGRRDFARGWCYLPTQLAAAHGVPIERLYADEYANEALAAINQLIGIAAAHLDQALEYTLTVPRRQPRIRLFNLWSLLFAIRTLAAAWNNRALLAADRNVKISRAEVYTTLLLSTACVFSDRALRQLYQRLRRQIGTN